MLTTAVVIGLLGGTPAVQSEAKAAYLRELDRYMATVKARIGQMERQDAADLAWLERFKARDAQRKQVWAEFRWDLLLWTAGLGPPPPPPVIPPPGPPAS